MLTKIILSLDIKKLLSLLLTIILLFSAIPFNGVGPVASLSLNANAADSTGSCGKNLTWTYNSSTATLTISGTGAMTNYNSTSYDGSTVTSAPWKAYYLTMQIVVIGNEVTSIGKNAFRGCTGLTSINIPNSVTSIGSSAFYNCTGMTDINYNAVSVSDFTSSSRVFYNAGTEAAGIDVIFGSSVQAIPAYLFYVSTSSYRPKLKSVAIGSSVTDIGNYAFCNCTELVSVAFPNKVTRIGQSAFSGCTGLTSMTIPNSVTSIGDDAFRTCTGLTSVTFGNNITSIGRSVFYGCISLTSISIPNSVTSIDSHAFHGCASLKSVNFGSGVASVGDYAFSDCTGLTSVTIPNSVTSIGENAFWNCTGLNTVTLGNSITGIGRSAFSGCSELTSVNIPTSVTSIGDRSFNDCTSLTSVTIPDNVTEIGSSAFYLVANVVYHGSVRGAPWGARSLNGYVESSLVYADSTKTELLACPSSYNGRITIPKSVTRIGYDAFHGCVGLTAISVDTANPNYSSDSYGVLYDENKTQLIQYPIGNSRVSFAIPDSVVSIKQYAFKDCAGLTNVNIPNSVTSIGGWAFNGCTGLKSVTIPNSVLSIYDCVFEDCTELASIVIPDSVMSIGADVVSNTAYYNNPDNWQNDALYIGNHLIKVKSSVTGAFEIKSGTKCIPRYAFGFCTGLTSVTIPESVTGIGSDAFSQCTGLTEINYNAINATSASSAFSRVGTEGVDLKVTFGSSVQRIPAYLFENCSNLKSVTIGSGVTSVDGGAFYECTGLSSVNIPSNVTNIGERAFYGCTGLTSVTISNSDTSIGQYAFYGCDALTSAGPFGGGYDYEFGWTNKIPAYAFSGCTGLTSVTIPDRVTSIGKEAFYGCTGLTHVTIPDGVTSIGKETFYGCTGLTSITIPDSVASIGDHAFYNTAYYNNSSNWRNNVLYISNHLIEAKNDLSGSYAIKQNTRCIADTAFFHCSKLTSVTIPDSVTGIGVSAFYGCNGLTSVTIPASVSSIGTGAFNGCTHLTAITVNNNNQNYSGDGSGVLYNKNKTVLIQYPAGNAREGFNVPNSVTDIVYAAFDRCQNLTNVTVPDSVESIGTYAFSGCSSMTKLSIPGSVTSIGYGALSGCTGLTSAGPIGGKYDYEFGWIETIPANALFGCSGLIKVTIPNSVTSIGRYAFYNCKNLSDVFYQGTQEQWNAIAIDQYGNGDLLNANIHFVGDEPPHVHTYSSTVTKNPTCREEGVRKFTCKCGDTYTEPIEKLPHTPGEWETVIKPTETTEGRAEKHCTVCGAKLEEKVLPKLTVLKNEATGIVVSFDNTAYDGEVELKALKALSGSAFTLANQKDKNSVTYSIETLVNGVATQPKGKVTVKIPMPDGFTGAKLYYVNLEKAQLEELPYRTENGYIVFETTHFSYYAVVPAQGRVTLNKQSLSLVYKKSEALKAEIVDVTGANVKWSSSNEKVAKVDQNGKVTATGKGTATITCEVVSSNGNVLKADCNVTVKYTWWQWLIKILLFGFIWY